jgi:hypothetical protein
VTFNFLETHLRATLCGLLGGAGRLASMLVGGSWMSGTMGQSRVAESRRNWNRS